MLNVDLSGIDDILTYLDAHGCPFAQYCFCKENGSFRIVGEGGSSVVYDMVDRQNSKKHYAMKVIGVRQQTVSSADFWDTIRIQKILNEDSPYIMRVLMARELYVRVDETGRVTEVLEAEDIKDKKTGSGFLLQFVLMEKMEELVRKDKYKKVTLVRTELAEEKEVLKFAAEIGQALACAHENGVLHRDIKLENIFLDAEASTYKLGDFGIAKVTQSGMASTRTFTKGYGAPEVLGRLQDQYDGTADIYSFGIMLYLLLNDLRFPGSDTYHVNLSVQYSQDFCMPRPAHGSDALCAIIDRMCRFDPDERYQSMQEVMRDLNRLLYGDTIGYEKAHNMATGVLGACMCVLGAAARIVDVHSWVTFVFFSMAVILLYQFVVLSDPYNVKYARLLFSGNRYWLFGCVFYLTMMLTGAALHLTDGHLLHLVMTDSMIAYLSQVDLTKAGGVGFLLCIVWMIRKQILIKGNIDALNYKR